MKVFMLTLVCMPCILMTHAQSLLMPVGRDMGSGSYSRYFQDVLSVAYNPAGLSCLEQFTVGAYAEQRFLLREIPLYMAMAAIPAGAGSFGLQVMRIGNSAYYQQRAGLAYGRSLGRRIDIGLQFNHESTALPGYGAATTFSVVGGILCHPGKQWHVGMRVYYSGLAPVVYSGGIGFEASRDFLLSAEVVKAANEAAWLKTAASYWIIPQLALQAGIASRPPFHRAGVIYHLHALSIIIAASFHPQLGITPSTTIIWQRD